MIRRFLLYNSKICSDAQFSNLKMFISIDKRKKKSIAYLKSKRLLVSKFLYITNSVMVDMIKSLQEPLNVNQYRKRCVQGNCNVSLVGLKLT